MERDEKSVGYLPHVDGMRALAVTAVILFHLNREWLPGGFSGVDVFFVISGFVVSASAYSHGSKPFRSFFLSFISRRCLRIVPALLSVILLTALTVTLLIPDAWLSDDIYATGKASVFGVANHVLSRRLDGYFSPTTEFNPFAHAWSLGVEEQFYLIFPGVFWLWVVRRSCRGTLMTILALVGLCSFVYGWAMASERAASSFYLLPGRLWELLVGVLLFQSTVSGRWTSAGIPRKARALASALGFLLIGYGFWHSDPHGFPSPGALYPVLGTSLLLATSIGGKEGAWPMGPLASRPVRLVGRLSYSLYLWHWPVFVLFRWTVGLDNWVHRTIAVAMVVGLASICWYCIERPIRRLSGERRLPEMKIVVGTLSAMLVVSLLNGLLHHYRWNLSLSAVARQASDWYPTTRAIVSSDPCGVSRPAVEQFGNGRRMTYKRNACGLPDDGSTVFVVGDSHALAFGRMFAAYTARSGRRVVLYDNAGCAYLSLQPEREGSERCQSSSLLVTEAVVGTIRPGDVVFLPSLRMPRLVDQWTRYRREDVVAQALSARASARESGAIDAAIRVVARFTEKGARVVFEAPNLLLNAPAYRCIDVWTRSNPICAGGVGIDRGELERLRRPMFDAIDAVAEKVPGTTIFDPFPWLCPRGPTCTGFRDGRPLFFDADHVSGFANELLLPGFEAAVGSGKLSETGRSSQAR